MTKAAADKSQASRGLAREVSTTTGRRRAHAASRWFIALATIVAVLWQGAVQPSALWIIWGLAVLAWVASVPHVPHRRALSTAGWLWMGLGAYTALLLVPMPRGLVAAVHPAAVTLGDATQLALGLPQQAYLPIATAPSDAAFQVALYLICGALATLYGHGLMLPSSRWRPVRDGDLLGYLCAAGALLWLMAHGRWVSTSLPMSLRHAVREWALINPNHLAGLCALGIAFSMGRLLRTEDIAKRNAYLSLSLVLGGAAILTGSRGGVLACVLVAGGSLATIRPVWKRTRTTQDEVAHRRRMDFLLKALTGLTLIAMIALPFIETEVLPSFARGTNDGKLQMLGIAADQVDAGWLVGQGPGALPVALGMIDKANLKRVDFAENIVLERFIDQGIWGALPFFAILAWLMIRTAVTLRRGSPALAPWLGCGALMVQNMGDFSLEIAGGLMPFLLAATQLERLRTGGDSPRKTKRLSSDQARILVLSGTFVALLLGGLALARADGAMTRTARERLQPLGLAQAKAVVAADFGHDHFAFLMLCRKAAADGHFTEAVTLCSRSLALRPASDAARLVRFAAAIDAGDDKLLVTDLSVLLTKPGDLRRRALDICATHSAGEKALMSALVADPTPSYGVGRHLIDKHPALVEKLALHIRRRHPNKPYGIEVLRGELYVKRRHFREADRIATALIANEALAVQGWRLQARIYAHLGKNEAAFKLYNLVCEQEEEASDACVAAMKMAIASQPAKTALQYVRRHYNRVRGSVGLEHQYWLQLGRLFYKMQAFEDAISAVQRSLGLRKNAPEALALEIRIQLKLGDWRSAERLVDKLPKEGSWATKRVELANEVSQTGGRR
ncbi:MAG: hypothetical protein KC502_15620 [Myxococcales bacterium]|nr:hypothetical protein [Myxococcales bacterium]